MEPAVRNKRSTSEPLMMYSIRHWGRHFTEKYNLKWEEDITMEDCLEAFRQLEKEGVKREPLSFGQKPSTQKRERRKPTSNTGKIPSL